MTVIKVITTNALVGAMILAFGGMDIASAENGKRNHANVRSGVVPDGFKLKKRVRPYIPIKARETAMCCSEFSINAKGRPTSIDMRCTDRLFKGVATKALKRWEYKPSIADAPMTKRHGATAAFYYGIYNSGNKRKLSGLKHKLVVDGEYDLNPNRVCPLLFPE